MFSMTQKKKKTVPGTGEVTYKVGETAAAGGAAAIAAAAAQNKPSQFRAPSDEVRLPVGSGVVTGAGNEIQQRAPMGFVSFSNLANIFHTTSLQRPPMGFSALHGTGHPFHGAKRLRSPLGFEPFTSRANLFHGSAQQTPPAPFIGIPDGWNHFHGANIYQPAPPTSFAGVSGGGNSFHGSTSTSRAPLPTPLGLAGSIANLFTPQRIPVPFEGTDRVANLVHDNPFVPAPRGFVAVDGVGYVFHKITQQRTPVHYSTDGAESSDPVGGSSSRPQRTRRDRVALTMSEESYWEDGLTQLFRAIEAAPRCGHHDQKGYFFLGERCLVCFKKFKPDDDIYLYMGEYAYCSPSCRELNISFVIEREILLQEVDKKNAKDEAALKEESLPTTKKP